MKAAKGHVFKYGDNVDTDVIIPARYLNSFDAQGNWQPTQWLTSIRPLHSVYSRVTLSWQERTLGCGSSENMHRYV